MKGQVIGLTMAVVMLGLSGYLLFKPKPVVEPRPSINVPAAVITTPSSTNNSDCSSAGTIDPYHMPAFGSISSTQNGQALCQGLNTIAQDIHGQ